METFYQMKISIVTATFNSESTLVDTLNGVALQTHPDVEHIIVDGASKDRTLDIVHRHGKHVSKIISEPDLGIYDAMNKGIAMACGDVIGILNSDDFYSDNNVLSRVATVFEDESVDVCYADLVYVDRLNCNKVIRHWKSREFKVGLFRKGWCPAHPTFFVRRSVYSRLGSFNLTYKLAADAELMLRFLEVYHIKSRYIPKVWVKMRIGGETNRSLINVFRQNSEIFRAARASGIHINPIWFIFNKILNRLMQRIRALR